MNARLREAMRRNALAVGRAWTAKMTGDIHRRLMTERPPMWPWRPFVLPPASFVCGECLGDGDNGHGCYCFTCAGWGYLPNPSRRDA